MRVEIIRKGSPLPTIAHEGTTYARAPKKGKYIIRLTNDSCCRRLAIVSVDGINVIDGKDADHAGSGYVLNPREVLEIPGWRRSGKKAASFTFKEQKESYANKTGRGTTNVGVIGVAVFDEKPRPTLIIPTRHAPTIIREEHHHHYPNWLDANVTWVEGTSASTHDGAAVMNSVFSTVEAEERTSGGTQMLFSCSVQDAPKAQNAGRRKRSRRAKLKSDSARSEPLDVGTAYGEETVFETKSVSFERATKTPWTVVVLRYATKARLESWGVPVKDMRVQVAPSAFPREEASCPPPPGW